MLKRTARHLFRITVALVISSSFLAGASTLKATPGSLVRSAWWKGRPPLTQTFGCTNYGYEAEEPWRDCPGDLPRFHDGIDLGMRCGAPIVAPTQLTVVSVGGPDAQSFGPYYPRLRLPWGYDVLLGHVERTFVRPGQHVQRGTVIAYVGTFGYSTGCHLHFEVRPAGEKWGSAIDPKPFLYPSAPESGAASSSDALLQP
jgi:murein DD-endopeptidase MepM/ murein hydrolase activator NlpD